MFFDFNKNNEQRDRVIAYKKFLSTEEGKRVLFDLMNRYHVLNSHDGDPYKEGQRSVVLGILHQCNVNLEDFDKLLKGEM